MMHARQRGLTMISWVIIIALVAIQGVAAMRIVPVYLNYSSVKTIMDELKEDPEARGAAPSRLSSMISKRLSINNIYDLQDNKDAFEFQKTSTGMLVTLHYEARGPIYGNLEFVATFDHEVEIPNQ
jgi:hypothetical protein